MVKSVWHASDKQEKKERMIDRDVKLLVEEKFK